MQIHRPGRGRLLTKIIDAAVELFATAGYGETGLTDVISAAEVTKGSFYYHFDSKEAVATAINAKSEEDFRESTIRILSSPASPALDNLIRSEESFPPSRFPTSGELLARMARQYEHHTNIPDDA